MLKDTRFRLVQAECPYVQCAAVARVISTEKVHSRGYKRSREGHVLSLWWKGRTGVESSVAAQLCVMWCVVCFFDRSS